MRALLPWLLLAPLLTATLALIAVVMVIAGVTALALRQLDLT